MSDRAAQPALKVFVAAGWQTQGQRQGPPQRRRQREIGLDAAAWTRRLRVRRFQIWIFQILSAR